MGAEASVVACSNCSALYTAGPGDRGICADCRRRLPATPPPRPPMAPIARVAAPMAPPRMTPTDTRRPNFRPARRGPRPTTVIKGVIVAGVVGLLVWQRQWLSKEWTTLQRHGVSGEWAAIQRKASDLWVDVRSRLPGSGSESGTSSTTTSRTHTADRAPHHHAQVAERSTKRKGATKQKQDLNTPGSTP